MFWSETRDSDRAFGRRQFGPAKQGLILTLVEEANDRGDGDGLPNTVLDD